MTHQGKKSWILTAFKKIKSNIFYTAQILLVKCNNNIYSRSAEWRMLTASIKLVIWPSLFSTTISLKHMKLCTMRCILGLVSAIALAAPTLYNQHSVEVWRWIVCAMHFWFSFHTRDFHNFSFYRFLSKKKKELARKNCLSQFDGLAFSQCGEELYTLDVCY